MKGAPRPAPVASSAEPAAVESVAPGPPSMKPGVPPAARAADTAAARPRAAPPAANRASSSLVLEPTGRAVPTDPANLAPIDLVNLVVPTEWVNPVPTGRANPAAWVEPMGLRPLRATRGGNSMASRTLNVNAKCVVATAALVAKPVPESTGRRVPAASTVSEAGDHGHYYEKK